MAKQADLFTFDDDAEQTYPQRPGFVRDSDTSRAAADSFDESDLSRQKQLIMGCYHARRNGLTCDEIEVALGFRHQTASARIRELVLNGFLVDTGLRRQTRSGRPARIYAEKIQ
jgi:Fic family protein